ncbi:FAS1 domain-containing protein [Pyronema omphalodes]|nr:FAS1 domain-containing protein [Pyronema omphalodes]
MFELGREWDLWDRVEEVDDIWEEAEENDMPLAPVFKYTKKEDVLDGSFDEDGFTGYGHPDTGDHDDRKPIHKPKMPPRDPHGPHMNSTIYDLLQKSKHSKRFFELIKEDKDLSAMLQDRNNNHTVFVPSNKAFDMLDKYKKHHNVTKEMLHDVLLYHIAPGYHQGQDLRFHNTLVSSLPAPDLGDDLHQRLRIGLNKKGPTVNFYSQFVMLDVRANNGVIHGLSSILFTPPPVKSIFHCIPEEFSTTAGALKKTGLLDLIDQKDHPMTLFAPSNHVWKRLGHKITSFLFSNKGEKYLKTIMKYHIVPDHVLYSDAMAGSYRGGIPPEGLNHGYTHLDMPTLLKNKTLSVDITRMERFLSFRVNGLSEVVISDGITKSGVLHVLDHLLIPPHSLGDHRNPPSLITPDYLGFNSAEDMDLDIEVRQFLSVWTPMVRAEVDEERRIMRDNFERMMIYNERLLKQMIEMEELLLVADNLNGMENTEEDMEEAVIDEEIVGDLEL